MIVWANVVAVAPQLATFPSGGQQSILTEVNAQIDDCVWGGTPAADTGRAWLAAHLATIIMRRGNGPLTAESVGQLSRSYGAIPGIDGSLALTGYGAEFLRLCRRLPTVLGFVP